MPEVITTCLLLFYGILRWQNFSCEIIFPKISTTTDGNDLYNLFDFNLIVKNKTVMGRIGRNRGRFCAMTFK